jgi:hypothetical protein
MVMSFKYIGYIDPDIDAFGAVPPPPPVTDGAGLLWRWGGGGSGRAGSLPRGWGGGQEPAYTPLY